MTEALGPELGRLSAPAGPGAYDDIRLALVDAVLAAKATGQMEQVAWDAAFHAAMRSLRMRLLARAEAVIAAAAAYSRFPARRRRALLPDDEAADTLLNRLLAEGMPLERFEGQPDNPETRRARAAALGSAWEGAVRVAATEESRLRLVAGEVAAWRRPTPPLWVASIALVVCAGVVAAWLSGDLESPRWFHPINEFWWRLWP